MKPSFLLIAALVFLPKAAHPQTGSAVGKINLDGHIQAQEWKNAQTHSLQRGGTVSIQQDSEFVYIGIKALRSGWTHVYVARGNSVFVLHASAALGTAEYAYDGSHWKLKQQFIWELRDEGLTKEETRRRIEFLKKRDWVGTVNGMHETDQEIILRRSAFDGPIAVLHASDAASPHFWPAGLSDGTLHRDLIYGTAPDSLSFDISHWSDLDQP